MDETRLRSFIVRILKENDGGDAGFSYDPYDYAGYGGGGGYDGGGGGSGGRFMGPIKDTFKAIGLAGKDIINSTKLIVKSLYTFSPENLKRARDEYNQRKNRIAQEWAPILKSTSEAIENSDLGVVTFALAPNIFFGIQMAKFAKGAPMAVGNYLYDAGLIPSLPDSWKQKLDRSYFSSDSKWEEFKRGSQKDRSRSGSDKNSISDRIRIFFFGEAIVHDSDKFLFEQDGQSEGRSGGQSPQDYIAQFEKLIGTETTEELRTELLKIKKESVEKIIADVREQIQKMNNPELLEKEIKEALDKASKNEKGAKTNPDQPPALQDSDKKKIIDAIVEQKQDGIKNVLEQSLAAIRDLLSEDLKKTPPEYKNSTGGREFEEAVRKIEASARESLGELSKSPPAATAAAAAVTKK